MYTRNLKKILVFSFFVLTISLFAYDPVPGAEEKNKILSTSVQGGQASASGGAFADSLTGNLAVNPALAGAEQRPILDVSYLLLADVKNKTGFGHVVNLGALYPARWGTLAGSIHFINSEFTDLKLGTLGSLRFSYSKDLTDKLLLGAGLYLDFGKSWALGADIGGLYKFGDLSIFKDSKLGISLTGLGITYNTNTKGIKNRDTSGSPAMITPHVGFATTLVKIPNFKLGMHFDISSPFFQNFVFNTALHMEIMDMISFRTGFVFNTLETIHKKQTYIPSFNLGVNIKIKSSKSKDSFMHKQGWQKSDLRPEFSAKPFHNGIWAFGLGVNMHLGLKDEEPPKIDLEAKPGEVIYFSPNNDGEKDAMEIPLSITDKRYVTAWSCEIKDLEGKTVRTISNKIPLREMKDIKSFFKLLGKSKKAVEIPKVLRWDGRTDSGELAKDGKYTFVIKAEDDNKNLAKTKNFVLVIDKKAPELELKNPKTISDYIFSPDGDGNKDEFKFDNKGSKEDLWLASISNKDGKIIRTIKVKNSKLDTISWDGKNNEGLVVADGVYKYNIEAKDKAGNRTAKTLSNIIVDTNKPSINISIDKKAFSPKLSSIEFSPSVPIKKGLTEWTIDVKDDNSNIVKSFKGTAENIRDIKFDGKDKTGKILAEGKYKAFISAKYINGHKAKTQTPSFEIDSTAPKASVSASTTIFSPDGDGELDSIIFSHKQDAPQKAKAGDKWIAEIYKCDIIGNIIGEPICRNDFVNILVPKFEWQGRKSDGSFAEDGRYAYILKGMDEAKNSSVSKPLVVELNTEKADIMLQSNYTAFSPNKDSVKDNIEFYPIVKSKTKVLQYQFLIKNLDGLIVKKLTGSKAPKKIIWDAKDEDNKLCKDGVYTAEFKVELANKQKAESIIQDIIIDTEYPSAEISSPYLAFSPITGNDKKTLPIKQSSSNEEKWSARFVNANNEVVKNYEWTGKLENIRWKADDDLGNKLPDGTYSYIVESEDKAGNKTTKTIKGIILDSREAKFYITTKLPIFSPTGNGKLDTQLLSLITNIDADIAEWEVKVSNVESGVTVAQWSSEQGNKFQKKLIWDGKELNSKKIAPDGNYMAIAYIEYEKGDIVTAFTEPFLLSTKAPKISVNLSPKYFSPDNDGTDDDLYMSLNVKSLPGIDSWTLKINEPESSGGKLFWKTGGKNKITKEIIWDGRSLSGETVQSASDYPFTLTVKDQAGLSSTYRGYIPVDILLIRDGNKLKIAVPSIIFRGNAADFNGLDSKIVNKNTMILKRIAEILNKFPQYNVTVEGHANRTTDSESEEKEYLLPLSNLRAEAVKNILIKYGVSANRLSSLGMGSSQPVASIEDKDNWWKNRRVEFILIKPNK